MKVVWNTCDKELGGEMNSINKNFRKSLSFGEIYVKYLDKNSIVVGILF